MQNSNPIFSQYDYIEHPVFKRILKTYYNSVRKYNPPKAVRVEMLELVKFDLLDAARFWLETQGKSEEWKYGLE